MTPLQRIVTLRLKPVRRCRTPTRSASEEREKEAKPRLRFGLV